MGENCAKKVIKNMTPYGIVRAIERRKQNENGIIYEHVPQREFYNVNGERIHTFYLKDQLSAHQPWGFVYGRTPKTILWDRMHPGLDIHFYTHKDILRTVGKPRKKFAYLLESETIVPEDYKIFEQKGLDKEFDLIFTYSSKLLNQLPNARFLPASGVWYANELSGNALDARQYEKKNKMVSLIASNKQDCELHKIRKNIALEMKKLQLADTFGTFDGGERVDFVDSTLKGYRYQIVIENEISDYYFTEKVLNCFAAMTIPVYIGALKIGEFFNEEGIIHVAQSSSEGVIDALKNCTEQYYEEHINAVLDNFNRVQAFLCIEDYLMLHYGNILD